MRLAQGSALLLPAYWYHQVESFAPPGRLNVALNCWFDGGAARGQEEHGSAPSPAALHRVLRAKLRVDCT